MLSTKGQLDIRLIAISAIVIIILIGAGAILFGSWEITSTLGSIGLIVFGIIAIAIAAVFVRIIGHI